MQDTARPEEPPIPPPTRGAPTQSAAPDEHPALYRVGVILIAGKALLWLLLLCVGWLAMAVGVVIGMAEAHGDDAFGFLIGGVIGTFVMAAIGVFQIVVLFLALKAWSGRRPWVYVLMALAVLNVASGGPIGIAVGVVALIGCVQVLDRPRSP
jgi:hypothetical protein